MNYERSLSFREMDYGKWNSGDWVCSHGLDKSSPAPGCFLCVISPGLCCHFSGKLGDDHSHLDGFLTAQPHELFSQPLVLCGHLFLFCHWSQDVNWHLCGEKSHLFLRLCCPDLFVCFFFFFGQCIVTECFLLASMAYDWHMAICKPLL